MGLDVAEIAAVLGLSVKEEDWDHALELIDKVKKSTEEVGHVGKKAGEEAAEGWAKLKEMAELTEHFLEEYIGFEGVKTIGEMTEKVVGQTMQLQHLSERYGVTVETLQNFDYMARLTGTSLQSVTNAMQRMEFGLRATSKSAGIRGAAGALQKLGISATEFKKADMNGQLGMLADKFEKMADPNQKIAMAMQLGGRGMVNLIPLLSQGRDKMHELSQEAQELGYNLDPKQAAEYEEQQAKLQLQWDGLKTRIVSLLLPALKQLGEWLSRIMTYFREHPEQLHRLLILIGLVAASTSAAMFVLGVRTLFTSKAFGGLLGSLGPLVTILMLTYEAATWVNDKFGQTPAIIVAVTGAVIALGIALRGLKSGNGILGSVVKKLLGLGGGTAADVAGGAVAEGALAEGGAVAAGAGAGALGGAAATAGTILLPVGLTAAALYGAWKMMPTEHDINPMYGSQRDEEYMRRMGYDEHGQRGDIHITAPISIHTTADAEETKQVIANHLEDQYRKTHQDMNDGEE